MRPLHPIRSAPDQLAAVEGVFVAQQADEPLRRLLTAARADNTPITVISGYRSYDEQKALYENYTAMLGNVTADEISSRPGHSEHQTGLAVDIGNPDNACALAACFAKTPAGAWVSKHGWKYGFIIRYPQGAEKITGYQYEPWHLRYVGKTVATALHGAPATLERYVGLPAAPGYR